MLTHPTLEKMKSLRLSGMAKAYEEQLQTNDIDDLSFDERLGLLIDREEIEKSNKRLQTRLRKAKFAQSACVEDLDLKGRRGIDRTLSMKLIGCNWIGERLNFIATGSTGVGKSYLACALGQKACREGYTVEYHRAPRLFPELHLAKGDGRYETILRRIAKTDLLIIDDFGLHPMNDEARRDCLELIEDRCGKRSTLVTSQIPLDQWFDVIGDPTLADAILDRLVHNAYKVDLKGESMRKRTASRRKNRTEKAPAK
ncbi:MAG: ATP-binding protein [Planctomycetes bacterium]|nr:ATP-binding protein [Planctomycetota bacterium]